MASSGETVTAAPSEGDGAVSALAGENVRLI